MNRRILLLGLTAAILAVTALFSVIFRQPVKSAEVRIGYLAISSALPLFVAVNEGLLEQQGIKVKMIEFKSSNEVAVAAATKQIDIIGAGATNAILDAMATSNVGMRMFVANEYVKRPNGQSSDFLLARPEIKSMADLKGKKVAFMVGSVGRVFADEILPKHGLSISDIQYVEIPPPQWQAALSSGAIDAVTALEPFATNILKHSKVNILIDGYYAEVMPRVPASGAFFVDGALTPADEKRVVDAFRKAISIIETDKSKSLAALERFTQTPKDVLPDLRFLEWSVLDDPKARQAAQSLAEIFAKNKGIQKLPAGSSWLWEPRN